METLKNKKNVTVSIDERFKEKMREKVDKAIQLYIKNMEEKQGILFSVYYSYFVNELLEEMEK